MTLNIVCVNHDNYLGHGDEYVNRLQSALLRCITRDFNFRVVTKADVPADVEGWWAKLWLFSTEAFPAGERVLFFDLDTVPTGPMDFLADYKGAFATLRDWYSWHMINTSIMAWEAGEANEIWDRWCEAGRPKFAGGDEYWIWLLRPLAPRLQDMFPGKFVSYKVKPSVVCFHGHPRPHEVNWEL